MEKINIIFISIISILYVFNITLFDGNRFMQILLGVLVFISIGFALFKNNKNK